MSFRTSLPHLGQTGLGFAVVTANSISLETSAADPLILACAEGIASELRLGFGD